ncbi:hypothetical protein PYW08_003620 [Mythimna loreyi]|uniref:Uncharacterized protein n=1 Tax=Mythimna loreyi TaxID=667449 RepID=A0ACC2QVE5_9NEOP|nr:hypothetical protein PYW08_003620 [Mythimna loreyi]
MTGETAPPAPARPVVNITGIHLTKTETEYNMKSIRFLLLTITAMFMVIATLMIVLGISVYTHYHGYSFFYAGKVSGIMTPSAMSVFIGLALLIVSIFGFFGSLKLSTCMVNMYAFILMVVFIIKLATVILAFTVDSNKLMHYIYVPVASYNDPEIQQEVDILQSTFSCCGSNTFMDYYNFYYTNNQDVVKARVEYEDEIVDITLPRSCCVDSTGSGTCDKIFGMGCKTALVNSLVQNSTVIGVLGVSVMFINLLGIIFALLLARCIRKLKSARALVIWKLKENMIMQREAEEMQKNEGQVYIEQPASSQA